MSDWTARPGERFELGEGLRFLGDRMVMVDILRGRLLELDLDPTAEPRVLAEIGVPLGAVEPHPDGWLAAAGTGLAVIEPGGVRWLARPEQDAPVPMRMNDARADPHGRFWAGSMAFEPKDGEGSLYRLDPDGTVTRVLTGLTIPNGPAFGLDGSVMYLADSDKGVIYQYPVDSQTGELGAREDFARVDSGSPDGMTVDEHGFVWSAIWGAGEIRRFTPSGELDRILPVPAAQPTSLCVLGDRITFTSAAIGLAHPGEFDGAVLSGSLA